MKIAQRGSFAWAAVGLLAVICTTLAILQYRWLGEISNAELDQLHKDLNNRLELFSRNFDEKIAAAARARNAALSDDGIFLRAARISQSLGLELADPATGAFQSAEWPMEWLPEREALVARMQGSRPVPPSAALLEVPIFGPAEQSHLLLLEWNLDYVRRTLAPGLVSEFLGADNYDVAILGPAHRLIYESSPHSGAATEANPDGFIDLLREPIGPEPGHGPPPRFGGPGRGPAPVFGRGPGAPRGGRGGGLPGAHWILVARHHAGSLEAIVGQARERNIAASAGMLLLIVVIAGLLVRTSREAGKLAALQMSFVTGVSHELRTPLTVIRTAGFNLRSKLSHRPDQVEKYGKLIEDESGKLTGLVEQVLLFARADSEPAARDRKPVAAEDLIESSLAASLAANALVEKQIAPDLPAISVDRQAMEQAMRNLFDNAVKYGDGLHWLGINARSAQSASGNEVVITVSDHGPGIPREEQAQIFEPFFRGKRAVDDQIHGTGLGLNLARTIIEANGGRIRVSTPPTGGTEFTIVMAA